MQYYLLVFVPIGAAAIAQICKFIIFSFKHKVDIRYLFEYGHMPSSHAAMMTALLVVLGYSGEANTPAYIVAFTITILVMMDALRLRMYIGSYGKTLNSIITTLGAGDKTVVSRLKERVGHKPIEVLGGVLVGIITALVSIRIIEIITHTNL